METYTVYPPYMHAWAGACIYGGVHIWRVSILLVARDIYYL